MVRGEAPVALEVVEALRPGESPPGFSSDPAPLSSARDSVSALISVIDVPMRQLKVVWNA
jgi:hypothetical protein